MFTICGERESETEIVGGAWKGDNIINIIIIIITSLGLGKLEWVVCSLEWGQMWLESSESSKVGKCFKYHLHHSCVTHIFNVRIQGLSAQTEVKITLSLYNSRPQGNSTLPTSYISRRVKCGRWLILLVRAHRDRIKFFQDSQRWIGPATSRTYFWVNLLHCDQKYRDRWIWTRGDSHVYS